MDVTFSIVAAMFVGTIFTPWAFIYGNWSWKCRDPLKVTDGSSILPAAAIAWEVTTSMPCSTNAEIAMNMTVLANFRRR